MKKKRSLNYLTVNERAALDEYVGRLRAKYADQVVLVRLFGSKARGDFDAESDIDVLVVVKNSDWRFSDQVVVEVCDPNIEYNVVLSPIILSWDEYQRMQAYRAPFYQEVQRDGIDVWTTPLAVRSPTT
jgi:hypothetical protein